MWESVSVHIDSEQPVLGCAPKNTLFELFLQRHHLLVDEPGFSEKFLRGRSAIFFLCLCGLFI